LAIIRRLTKSNSSITKENNMATGQALPERLLAMPVQITPSLYPWNLAIYNTLSAPHYTGVTPITIQAAILALGTPAGALPDSVVTGLRRVMGFAILPLGGGPGCGIRFCESGVALPVPHSGGGYLYVAAGVWSLGIFSVKSPLLKANVMSQDSTNDTTYDLALFLDRLPTE
jgi:hypothetical protein